MLVCYQQLELPLLEQMQHCGKQTQRGIKDVKQWETIWRGGHTHAHKQGEQNKQCVFICYHGGVRSGAKPHAEGSPIRRGPWQT